MERLKIDEALTLIDCLFVETNPKPKLNKTLIIIFFGRCEEHSSTNSIPSPIKVNNELTKEGALRVRSVYRTKKSSSIFYSQNQQHSTVGKYFYDIPKELRIIETRFDKKDIYTI